MDLENKKYLTFSEAEQYTGISRKSISERIRKDCKAYKGKPFPHDHFGSNCLIPVKQLDQYMDNAWESNYECEDEWHYKDSFKEEIRQMRRVVNTN